MQAHVTYILNNYFIHSNLKICLNSLSYNLKVSRSLNFGTFLNVQLILEGALESFKFQKRLLSTLQIMKVSLIKVTSSKLEQYKKIAQYPLRKIVAFDFIIQCTKSLILALN